MRRASAPEGSISQWSLSSAATEAMRAAAVDAVTVSR
jgi:hypothetical protein